MSEGGDFFVFSCLGVFDDDGVLRASCVVVCHGERKSWNGEEVGYACVCLP